MQSLAKYLKKVYTKEISVSHWVNMSASVYKNKQNHAVVS